MEKTSHIARAISRAGGPVAAARKTGAKNYQTVQQWERSGNVPSKYALALEQASGVSRRLLCKEWQAVWPELIGQSSQPDIEPDSDDSLPMEGPDHA